MRKIILLLTLLIYSSSIYSQADKVEVVKSSSGFKLKVNGKDFIINGMNWDYYPIGTNYSYSLWKQSDEVIMAALDAEMGLLKNMGVNTIRQYTGIQSKWITYIYQKYGIYTMINHSFGRYGLTLNGTWVPNTEYSNELTQQTLLKETKELVAEYKNTPGLLMFLLGNENNYGLFWDGAESENIPLEDRRSTARAKDMYKLFNHAVVEMKKIDKSHPIAICNGDLLFIDIIAKICTEAFLLQMLFKK